MSQFSVDANEMSFAEDVIEASHRQPVLVDFWAPWCGPCRSLKPILEALADDYGGRFRLVKINSDEAPQLSARYGVRSIPCVKAFVGGQLVGEFLGAQPESEVRKFIDRLLPSPAEPLRAEAAALWDEGKQAEAIEKIAAATQADPHNEDARIDAVEMLIEAGRSDEARLLLKADFVKHADHAQALRVRLDLTAVAGDEAAFIERLAADPADLAARIDLARVLAARGAVREALDDLLEAVRRDRHYADGLARKTMLQLFDLLGADPEGQALVREYRRALAMALN